MKKQEILELLEHTEQDVIFSFIAEYAEENKQFYEKLKEALLPDDDEEECDVDYYRARAEECYDFSDHYGYRRRYDYYEAAYNAASGLNTMLGDASYLEKQGKYAGAAAIAMAVAEVIPRNFESVDDSMGRLGCAFDNAIELLCNIIKNENIDDSVKKEIYHWSKKEADNSIYLSYGLENIDTIYEVCCEQFGDTDEVLAELDRKINAAKYEYDKCKIVLWKIRFMRSRNLDIQDVVQTYLNMDKVRKVWFEQLKDEGKLDEALQIAEQGLKIADDRRKNNWKKSMFDIYLLQGDTVNLLPMAGDLLVHARWDFNQGEIYQVLKDHTPAANWQDTMDRMLAAFEKGRDYDPFAAHIMHEHQLWQRLFDYCKKGNITAVEKYENDLIPHFEKDILELYHNNVEKQALVTDSSAYAEVARMLKKMRTFAGGNELVNQLLEKYRTTFKRRKNMMEALKGV